MTSTDTSLYLSGNYAPVTEEVTAFDLPVIGELPAELNGRYLRNGPNPMTAVDPVHPPLVRGRRHGPRHPPRRRAGRVVPQPLRRIVGRQRPSRRARHPRAQLERQLARPQHQRRRICRHHVGDGRGRRLPGRADLRARDRRSQRLLRHVAGRLHSSPQGRSGDRRDARHGLRLGGVARPRAVRGGRHRRSRAPRRSTSRCPA